MKGTCTNDKGISAFFTNVKGTLTNVGDISYTNMGGSFTNVRGISAILM